MDNKKHLYQVVLTADEYHELLKAIHLSEHIINAQSIIGEKIDINKLNNIKDKILKLI